MGSPATVTYGPIFIGVILNIMLYGIMITQMFLYFTVYKRDKKWMKIFVMILFLCDTLNSAFDVAFVYIPLVTKYGDVQALSYATWIFSTDPVMTSIIALMVQMFFAWRVKVLTNNWFIVSAIMVCSVAQWCGGLGTSIACGIVPEFVHFQKFEVIVIIWLAFSATADTIITCALVWHLRKHKTGFSSTDDVVNKIIRLTVQTGMITAVCAIIDLIAFVSSPSGIHLVFNIPLAKLYTNSLMSSLNSRAGWKYGNTVGKALNMGDTEVQHSGGSNESRAAGQAFGSHLRPVQQVFIDVESHELKERADEQHTVHKVVHSVPSDLSVNEFPAEKRAR
ncbi:hypothetical protein BDW22DRAFT_1432128 [Trametopsis cervina]|nr:hypothetical protein BDW22DRAFT_1432128 [Trametopsis cervina]